jgi:hypothetical protein
MMTDISYATRRKTRIIEEQLGNDWRDKYPNKSIDAVYVIAIGDIRKNLFCKVDPDTKSKLDEMVAFHDVKMSELVEKLVKKEYDIYVDERNGRVDDIATQFATTG